MFIFLGEGTFTRHYTHFLSDLWYRVCTRLSSSNSMTFRDIFNDLFEVFMTLGLAVTFKTFFFLEHFLTYSIQQKQTLVSTKMGAIFKLLVSILFTLSLL